MQAETRMDRVVYSTHRHGSRIYVCSGAVPVSPWHDVPCLAPSGGGGGGTVVNMVCEVPAGTRIKYEVSTSEPPLNPIRRDRTDDGRPRSYPMRMPWNYGMIPGTWEDPDATDPDNGLHGDGDPLDVVDITARRSGQRRRRRRVGEVYAVRLVGALALVDSGELDWKMLAVDAGEDADADADVEALQSVKAWFVDYKPGKGNRYEHGGKLMPPGPVLREAMVAYATGLREGRIVKDKLALQGGAVLGEGAQGSIRTMDELKRVLEYEPTVRLVWANLGLPAAAGNSAAVLRSGVMPTDQVMRIFMDRAVFKVVSADVEEGHEEAVDQEFSWMLSMAKAVAASERAREIAGTLAQNTPFMFVDDTKMIVGVECTLRSTNGLIRVPFYRKMDGSIDAFCTRLHARARLRGKQATVRADVILSSVASVLKVVSDLSSVDVHHMDIKEENVLFNTECEPSPSAKGCKIRFALTDFGLSVIRPDKRHSHGTMGYKSSALLKDDDKSRDEFVTEWIVSASIATPKETWISYAPIRRLLSGKGRSLLPGQLRGIYEKNDLFGLGVMLSRFLRSSGKAALGVDALEKLRMLARSLILGPAAVHDAGQVLVTAKDALVACRRLQSDPDVARLELLPPSFNRHHGAWSVPTPIARRRTDGMPFRGNKMSGVTFLRRLMT